MHENEQDGSVNISQDTAKGTYSNLAIVTHSENELILDFAAFLPGMPKPEVVSRIIMTPERAKQFYLALKGNLEKYEANFGRIGEHEAHTEPEKPMGPSFPMGGFGNTGAQS